MVATTDRTLEAVKKSTDNKMVIANIEMKIAQTLSTFMKDISEICMKGIK